MLAASRRVLPSAFVLCLRTLIPALLVLATACQHPSLIETRPHSAEIATATLGGVVHEVEGRAIGPAVVELRRTAPVVGDARVANGRRSATLELAPDGRFLAEGLEPGAWELVVHNAGRADFTKTIELARGETHALALDLPLSLVIAGRVVDKYGEPVVGVRIGANGAGGVPIAWSVPADALGGFRLVGFERGECWLHVDALADRASLEGRVTMADFEWKSRAGLEHLELVQPIERALTVAIVDARGAAVPDARLHVAGLHGCVTARELALDARGRTRIVQPEGRALSFTAWRTRPRAQAGERELVPESETTATNVPVEDRELRLVLP
ncbi:MAG: hypothetical protein IPJ77_14695 [Planctomycetes bacterium]|nr:hypothetical protein [Planctomycetota bacterium]